MNFVFSWAGDLTIIEPESLSNRIIQISENVIKMHKKETKRITNFK